MLVSAGIEEEPKSAVVCRPGKYTDFRYISNAGRVQPGIFAASPAWQLIPSSSGITIEVVFGGGSRNARRSSQPWGPPEIMAMKLLNEFIRAAESAAATVETIPPNAGALTRCLLKRTGESDCVLLGLAGDLDPGLFAQFRAQRNVVVEPTKEELRTISVGVTDAFCGVASTGSVCVSLTNSLSAPASMLTRRHIAVVDGRAIVPRVRDLFSPQFLDGKGLDRSFTFITGPSVTADMGPLVRGVHGPGQLHIIVLEEDHG